MTVSPAVVAPQLLADNASKAMHADCGIFIFIPLHTLAGVAFTHRLLLLAGNANPSV